MCPCIYLHIFSVDTSVGNLTSSNTLLYTSACALLWWSRCLDKNNCDFTSNYKASHWVLIKQDIICWVIVNNIIIIMATTVGFKTSQLNFDAQDLKRRVCKIHAILQSNLYWFHMQRKHRENKFFFILLSIGSHCVEVYNSWTWWSLQETRRNLASFWEPWST